MYIRRKVYSAIEDENGEIRYFSTNEIVSEEEYLENLYSEFYLDDDDMERIFSEKDYDKGLSKGAKIAIGAGSAAAAATALHFGGRYAAKKAAKGWELNAAERGLAKVNQGEKWLWGKTGGKAVAAYDTKKAVKATGFASTPAEQISIFMKEGKFDAARKLAKAEYEGKQVDTALKRIDSAEKKFKDAQERAEAQRLKRQQKVNEKTVAEGEKNRSKAKGGNKEAMEGVTRSGRSKTDVKDWRAK